MGKHHRSARNQDQRPRRWPLVEPLESRLPVGSLLVLPFQSSPPGPVDCQPALCQVATRDQTRAISPSGPSTIHPLSARGFSAASSPDGGLKKEGPERVLPGQRVRPSTVQDVTPSAFPSGGFSSSTTDVSADPLADDENGQAEPFAGDHSGRSGGPAVPEASNEPSVRGSATLGASSVSSTTRPSSLGETPTAGRFSGAPSATGTGNDQQLFRAALTMPDGPQGSLLPVLSQFLSPQMSPAASPLVTESQAVAAPMVSSSLDSVVNLASIPANAPSLAQSAGDTTADASASVPEVTPAETGSPPALSGSVPLGFEDGLAPWTIDVVGGTEAGRGSVTAGSAILTEGDSFLVSLERSFVVPENPSPLVFRYTELNFDTSDPDSINDAFEASVVGDDGRTLVQTFASGRDAFFNVSEDVGLALGPGATQEGDAVKTVSLDMTGVTAGTMATVRFRLVNNDQDTETSVHILEVLVPGDEPPTVSLALENDTAPDGPDGDPFRSDLLTNDAAVIGTASDDRGVSKLEASVDDGLFLDITASLDAGHFRFDPGSLLPGPHRITIRVSDTANQTTDASLDFRVNAPPIADAGGNRLADEGDDVLLDASGSSDVEGPLFSYRWEFDDGTSSDGATASHHYAQNGLYPVTLTVTDAAGSVVQDTVLVNVENLPAVIVPVADREADEGEEVTLEVTFTDPGVLDTHSAEIDWGDGTTSPAEVEEQGGAGGARGVHVYRDNGTYHGTLFVTDDGGATGSTPFTVIVSNVAPTLTLTGVARVDEGSEYEVTLGPVTDPGDDTVTRYVIRWGDSQSSVIDASDVPADRTVRHTYADGPAGYTVRVDLYDEDGTFADAGSKTVVVDNVAPTAGVSGPGTGIPGQSLAFTVTATDPSAADAAAGFRYTIDWGDGSLPQIIDPTADNGAGAAANHAYGIPGTFTVRITAADKDGGVGTASLSGALTVAASIYVLDPSASSALTLSGNGSLTASGVVVVDSSSGTALRASGNATVTASSIQVVGSYRATGNATFNPVPVTGAAYVPDPLAALAPPTSGTARGSVNVSGHSSQTLSPGVYGSIRASGQAALILSPGVYILAGGGLSVSGNASISGHGVTIYNAGGNFPNAGGTYGGISLSGNGVVDLTAPATGPFAGVLIFQARDNPQSLSLSGNAVLGMGGTVYAREAALTLSGNGQLGQSLVVDRLTLSGNGGTSTSGPTKFYVADAGSATAFRYGPTGAATGAFALGAGAQAPRGAAANAAGDTLWVVDAATLRVSVQGADGAYRGSWVAEGVTDPQGISTDGTDVWIVDAGSKQVLRYAGAAALTGGTAVAQSWFTLNVDNTSPSDLVTDGQIIWVTDDVQDEVFVYDTEGTLLGRWGLDPANADASGITRDPTGASNDLWVVDRVDRVVYEYVGASGWREGARTAESLFALAAANTSPEGITDPPATDGIVELAFDALPSTQGWAYGASGNSVPETSVFSIDGTTLYQNSIGVGFAGQGSNRYNYWGVVDPSLPFVIELRARVLQEEGDVLRNSFGFCFGVFTGIEEFGVAVGTAQIQTNLGIFRDVGDNTSFRNFRLEGAPGEGYKLFVDGVLIAAGPATPTNFTNSLYLGDGTGGTNARADVTFYRFSQPSYHVAVDATSSGSEFTPGSEALISGQATSVRSDNRVRRDIVQVTVNGTPVDVLDAAGHFFTKAILAPGQNHFEIVATDTKGLTASTTLTLEGVQRAPGEIDFSLFSDVSGSFSAEYGRTSFNEDTNVLYGDLAVRNAGQYLADTPLLVGVTNISDPTIRVRDAAGLTPDGIPYYDFTSLVADGTLAPGEVSGSRSLAFYDPNRVQFTYDLVFLGKLNRAPAITTVPDVEAIAGQPYVYNVGASDPDGDPLTFSLPAGPAGMVIDPETGSITWSPAADESGSRSVTVRVEDGRGGSAEQRYVLSVVVAPPNRPPVFNSVPVVSATVNTAYTYQATATDPDGDPLTFSVVSAPAGMIIDAQSGLVRWTPSALQGGTQSVTLQVEDGRGGAATQTYVIAVEQEAGNHPPEILTDPVSGVALGEPYRYDVDAIDPDGDQLTYSLATNPQGMTIDAQSGLIQWEQPQDILSQNAVIFSDGTFSPADWEHLYYIAGNPATTARAETISSGGNPGPYRRTTIDTYYSPDVNSSIADFHFNNKAIYNPYVDGEIFSIDWTIDALFVTAPQVGPALIQDGKVYRGPTNNVLSNGAWTTITMSNLDAVRFSLADPTKTSLVDSSKHPDFSRNGSPITLGFWTGGTAVLGTGYAGQSQKGFDNWKFIVNPKPEAIVIVQSEDGRGGVDTQQFTVEVTPPGKIQGFVYQDSNLDGEWNRGPDLIVNGGVHHPWLRYSLSMGVFIAPLVYQGELPGGGGAVFGPDGLFYVVDTGGDAIYRIDPQTGRFLDTFVSKGELHSPKAPAFGPDGNLYVFNVQTHSVLKYDGTTGAFLGTFASAPGLIGSDHMRFGPDGNLYVIDDNHKPDAIYRFNGTTGAYLGRIVEPEGGGISIAFGPDLNLYTERRGENSGVIRFNPQTGAYLGDFIEPKSGGIFGPYAIGFGPDGVLYVASSGNSKLLKYDGITGDFLGELEYPPEFNNAYAIDFTPDAYDGPLESTLPGRTVYLDENRNGRRDSGERFTTTDANGRYIFTNLGAGNYVVAEEPQSGWIQSAPASQGYEITVLSGEGVYNIDFGNIQAEEQTENHPPTFTTIPPPTVTVGQLYSYKAIALDPDGDSLNFALLVKATGMTVDPARGIIFWVPTVDQVGIHDVILRVEDGRGGTALQSFQVTVSQANSTPVFTSVPTGPAVVGLPWQYQGRAQDADGDTLTFQLDAGPAGMGVDSASGLVTWTPDATQVGSQHVALTVSDGHGASATQSFDLPVVATAANDPPAISSLPRTSTRLGDAYRYAVLASDPNGDPLTYSLPTGPAGMAIDAAGVVTWQPASDQLGGNPVQVRVEDGRGGFATQSFTINVTIQASNSPPSIVSTPPLGATVGRQYAYDPRASDPDGGTLTWSLVAAPAGVSLDPVLGSLRWTPASDQIGSQSFSVRVMDDQGAFATQTFTVAVRAVDVPPGITSVPPTTASVGTPYAYAVRATDPDGDPLTFSLTAGPAGMTIDTATGLILWTPSSGQLGSQDVALSVEDPFGGFATQSFTVVVSTTANQPPVITSTPPFVATAEQHYQYTVTAVDPDGQSVLFSLLDAPAGMTIDPVSGVVQWVPTLAQVGIQSVTVAAIDPGGAGGTQTFSVGVADNNNAPTITSSPVQVVTAGLPYRYDVQASDPDGDPISFRLDQAPAGMTIDALGRITWSPGIPAIGTHRIDVTVEDSRGAAITQSYDLAVLADGQTPRVSLFISANPAPLGSPVTFAVSATDNVGVTGLSLTINGSPVPLDNAGRVTLLAEPAGDYAIVASASDAAGNTGLATTTLTVIDTSDTQAPTVDLTSPADDAVIRSPVEVRGTATDDNLLYYTLEVAPVGGGPFTEIFRGDTPVVDGVLGTFDPSGLANDAYVLRLTAVDAGGNQSSIETTVNVAGDLKLGNFTLSFTDLSIPVSGIPITVSRTYDTLTAGTSSDFGFGWRLEFRDTNLRTSLLPSGAEDIGIYTPFRDGARVYVTLPGGRREGFTFRPEQLSGFGGYLAFYRPAFVPDPGVTSRLYAPGNVTLTWSEGGYYGLVNGGTLPYNPADELNFGGSYVLTTKEGLAYTIDATTGDVRTIGDPDGNVLTFSDGSIESNRGVRVTFDRDPQGRIVAVTDPTGQKVRYRYDARGDLVSVTDREGNETRFVYAELRRAHYLTEVIDPLGRSGVRSEYDEQGRLVTLIDADGQAVRLTHDPEHSLETVRDALGYPTTFEYDQRGNVVREVDALGGETLRTYDLENNLLSETDPLGRTTSYTYGAFGDVLTETDPLGNITRYTYEQFDPAPFSSAVPGLTTAVFGARPFTQLATTTDPVGNTTTNTYEPKGTNKGRLIATTDAAGNVTRYSYDSAGNQTSITDAAGNVTLFAYDSRGDLLHQTDALGHATDYTYDGNSNQLTQTITLTTPGGVRNLVTTTAYDASGRPVSVTDAEGDTTRTEYDALGHQTATVDALDHRTEFVYDDRGQLVQTLFADGTQSLLTYDAAGRRTSSTDRAGRVTRFDYDALGRLVETIYPDDTPLDPNDNPRTTTEYAAAGQVTAQIDERGNRTEFAYDDAGRQILVRDALGHEMTTVYDAAGRTVAMTDAAGRTTRFVLDALGRQVQTVFADATSTAQSYDPLGRVVEETDQAGRTTGSEYDALGRLTAVVDALAQRTEYGYDEAGDLVTQSDANGHVTRYEFDGLGRRVATVLPLGQRSTTEYDAVGNIASTTDFNGDTIVYEYDASNRLTAKHFPDGTSVEFSYTPSGQREIVTDARGTTSYQYDVRARLLSRTDPDGTAISYSYDAAGNRTSVTTPAGTTVYTFDALNRQETVTDPSLGVTRYEYDNVGNLVRTELPNGTTETRQYDDLNHLVYLETDGPSGVISSYRYTLAPTGRRDAVVEQDGRRVDYGYDALDRLTQEQITDAVFGNRTIDYTYDPVGNRLTRNDSAEGLTAYTHDDNDRLLTETLAGVATVYGYDDNGNTLSKVTSAVDQVFYQWDFENRLVGADVTDASGTRHIDYRYDADRIRVSSTVDGEETRFLIDTVQPYAQVLLEYRPSGLLVVSYVYGNDLIAQDRAGVRSFYQVDGLGSTRALTDGSGAVPDRYVYDAFGRTIGQVGSTANAYLFAGEQRDGNVGLDYLRARYLSVGTGRFYASDPFEGILTSPVSLHRFLYAGANSTNNIDPNGRFLISLYIETFYFNYINPLFGRSAATRQERIFASLFAVERAAKQSYAGGNITACNLFVKSVAKLLGKQLPEQFLGDPTNADRLIDYLRSRSAYEQGWRNLGNERSGLSGDAARHLADSGYFVIAGLKSYEFTPYYNVNEGTFVGLPLHGHVAVVVSSPSSGQYPRAYWGSLGGADHASGPNGKTLNYAFPKSSIRDVSYFYIRLW
jgi:RHS repeat-associated protein